MVYVFRLTAKIGVEKGTMVATVACAVKVFFYRL